MDSRRKLSSFIAPSFLLLLILAAQPGQAQLEIKPDTAIVLQEVTVKAYGANRSPTEIPASIGVIKSTDLARFSTTSALPAFNMMPGVRMEERSPGSYRFSIRGSLLRSPFGVRNIKFYWEGLPFTDGGGNTYLNLLDLYALGQAEIIKGPASSLYGAGTGGAVLLQKWSLREPGLRLDAQHGSYGAARYGGSYSLFGTNVSARIQFVRQQADGYRTQTAFKRNFLNADMSFVLDERNFLSVTLIHSDLYYQTPGGLTASQNQADPRQARPATPTLPGAIEQQAAVYNKTSYGGIRLLHLWGNSWSSTLGIVGSITDFKNPAIRNYETRSERNIGVRLTNEHEFGGNEMKYKVSFGGEYQHFSSPVKVTNNLQGVQGTQIISNDEITSDMALGFVQAEAFLAHGLSLTAGGSLNYLRYLDNRLALTPAVTEVRTFNPVFSPRVAVLKKFREELTVYVSASRGFSPPSVAELVPSTGIYNPNLNAETGWSYEAGVSGIVAKALQFHLAVYDFRLMNTIVLQRDSTGADFFVNAGDTQQNGIELALAWAKAMPESPISSLRFNLGLTYNNYKFGNYINDGNDYSGKALTGVAPLVGALGADVVFRKGFYTNLTANYVDRLPLNDANTDYASSYFLLGIRAGYRSSGKFPVDYYFGADNLFNQSYSLGNDLNATGGRYFNSAPTRNYYAGISVKLTKK